MTRKSRRWPALRVKDSSNDYLRILASLVVQFHVKKITGDKKPEVQVTDIGELNNDKGLS